MQKHFPIFADGGMTMFNYKGKNYEEYRLGCRSR